MTAFAVVTAEAYQTSPTPALSKAVAVTTTSPLGANQTMSRMATPGTKGCNPPQRIASPLPYPLERRRFLFGHTVKVRQHLKQRQQDVETRPSLGFESI